MGRSAALVGPPQPANRCRGSASRGRSRRARDLVERRRGARRGSPHVVVRGSRRPASSSTASGSTSARTPGRSGSGTSARTRKRRVLASCRPASSCKSRSLARAAHDGPSERPTSTRSGTSTTRRTGMRSRSVCGAPTGSTWAERSARGSITITRSMPATMSKLVRSANEEQLEIAFYVGPVAHAIARVEQAS